VYPDRKTVYIPDAVQMKDVSIRERLLLSSEREIFTAAPMLARLPMSDQLRALKDAYLNVYDERQTLFSRERLACERLLRWVDVKDKSIFERLFSPFLKDCLTMKDSIFQLITSADLTAV
jgi:hypothetical protein